MAGQVSKEQARIDFQIRREEAYAAELGPVFDYLYGDGGFSDEEEGSVNSQAKSSQGTIEDENYSIEDDISSITSFGEDDHTMEDSNDPSKEVVENEQHRQENEAVVQAADEVDGNVQEADPTPLPPRAPTPPIAAPVVAPVAAPVIAPIVVPVVRVLRRRAPKPPATPPVARPQRRSAPTPSGAPPAARPLRRSAPTPRLPTRHSPRVAGPVDPAPAPAAPLICRRCGKGFRGACVMSRHISDRHVGTMCFWPGCGTIETSEAKLLVHFAKHQRDAVRGGIDELICPWPGCGKEFSRPDTIQRCIKRHNHNADRGV